MKEELYFLQGVVVVVVVEQQSPAREGGTRRLKLRRGNCEVVTL
jgi:hypothetical protein